MDEVDRRLTVFENRISELESAVDGLADQVLQLEQILTEIASHLLPGESFEDDKEESEK